MSAHSFLLWRFAQREILVKRRWLRRDKTRPGIVVEVYDAYAYAGPGAPLGCWRLARPIEIARLKPEDRQ
jgi:hypothetical protein